MVWWTVSEEAARRVRKNMFDPGNSGQNKPRAALGCAVTALGLLILIPTGLCTAIFGVIEITEGIGPEFFGILVVCLILAAIGAGLAYAGYRMRR